MASMVYKCLEKKTAALANKFATNHKVALISKLISI